MKHKILTIAMCIACGIPMATHAEVFGYVEEKYYNGGLYTFIATYDSNHSNDLPWEYICSNKLDDMELAFRDIEIEFDWDSEDERDGYSYVNDCEVVSRTCASGKYIHSLKRADGTTEYSCKDCPTPPKSETVSSNSGWNIWSSEELDGITNCYISSRDQFTDNTGTYKYTENCYYKK